MRRAWAWGTLFVGYVLLSGCNFVGQGDEDRGQWNVESGALVFYEDTSSVELTADTVQVGEPLRIRATTFGGGCTRGAGAHAEAEGLRAAFTPLDSVYTPGPGEACTQELNVITHTAEVSFKRAGVARVVIEGVRQEQDVDGSEEVQLERRVVVE